MPRINTLAPFRSLTDFQQLLVMHQSQGCTTLRFHQRTRNIGVFSFHYDVEPDVPVYAALLDADTNRFLSRMWEGWYLIPDTLQSIEDFSNNAPLNFVRELMKEMGVVMPE